MDSKTIAHLLHSLFCTKRHFTQDPTILIKGGRRPNTCYFYLEDQLDEAWEMSDHEEWLEKAMEVKDITQNEGKSLTSISMNLEMLSNRPDLLRLILPYLQFLLSGMPSKSQE